jgi:hypothetical protein
MKENIMSKFFTLFALVAALLLSTMAFAPSAAVAASPAQAYCENELGGVYGGRVKGEVQCTVTTTSNTGKSENSQTIEKETTTTTNGTFNNKPQKQVTNDCDGPGNSGSGSNHCK